MERGRGQVLQAIVDGMPLHDTQREARSCSAQNAQQHCGAHPPRLQHGDSKQADARQRGLRRAQIAHAHNSRGVGHNDAGIAQADEGNEQPHARGHRCKQLPGDGIHDQLANPSRRQQQKDAAGYEDAAQRRLPGNAHALDDGKGKVRVQAHARRQGDGIVGNKAHQDAADGRRQAGGGGHRGHWHAGLAQYARVHKYDVGHGKKRSRPGKNLRAPGRSPFLDMEGSLEVTQRSRAVSRHRCAHGFSFRCEPGM